MDDVVVTGTGVITAAGVGIKPLLDRLARGETLLTHYDNEPWPRSRIDDGCIRWPDEPVWLDRKKYASRTTQLALTVTDLAMAAAGIVPGTLVSDDGATIVASVGDGPEHAEVERVLVGAGDDRLISQRMYDQLPDFVALRSFPSTTAQMVAARSHFEGGAVVLSMPTYGGLAGLGLGARMIHSGKTQRVVLVAVDTAMSPQRVVACDAVVPLATTADAGPYDRRRAGTWLGEGAVAMLLESGTAARERKARIHARVCKAATTAGRSLDESLAASIAIVGDFQTGDTIFAHGCGSPELDAIEAGVLAEAVGQTSDIAITATRGCTGNLQSTSALLDLCLAIAAPQTPPICLLHDVDPTLPALPLVIGDPRPRASRRVWLMSVDREWGEGAAAAVIEVTAP